MSMNYSEHFTPKKTPQSESADPRQEKNNAGGFSFVIDDWKRLERFLILGTEGGTYYVDERKLTKENAEAVLRCIKSDGKRTVAKIVEISDAGRAPKNDPALFALALAAKLGDTETRQAAYEALPKVARIGTHLFHFAESVKNLGGWGRATKRAFSKWYLGKSAKDLAFQVMKYQQRDGWAHFDLMAKAHPKPEKDSGHEKIFAYLADKWKVEGELPGKDDPLALIYAFEEAKRLASEIGNLPASLAAQKIAKLISDYHMPWECVPTQALSRVEIWEALLPHMGMTAMIRNLGRMTANGLIGMMSDAQKHVVAQLGNVEALKKARVHPLSILVAMKTYSQGHGEKGKLAWAPNERIVDALDTAFYLAFKGVVPTGKNTLLAIDCSGSMSSNMVTGMPLSAREGAAAMSLVTANVEDNYAIVGFSNGLGKSMHSNAGYNSGIEPLKISPKMRMPEVTHTMEEFHWGGTDCALPMIYALENKVKVDVFQIYTDSETWSGAIHPFQALREYRQKMGIAAKLIVIGMTATEFTIADPSDAGMMDVVGFDSAAPAVMADFARD